MDKKPFDDQIRDRGRWAAVIFYMLLFGITAWYVLTHLDEMALM